MTGIAKVQMFKAIDGSHHPSHAEAVKHSKKVKRTENLQGLLAEKVFADSDTGAITPEVLATRLAAIGDELQEALKVTFGAPRGPKKKSESIAA
ncbi:hypothetical protein [Chitinibacter tainanensis]|uniref:hypothetical protein n=1 Tax=Chitinibacter tainanensis TaxID=230667 RepID=UPI00041220A1|nr:hypothetical protein [Chitinibacter tainanensis]